MSSQNLSVEPMSPSFSWCVKSQDCVCVCVLCYPAVSHQCDPGRCRGNPADSGSCSERSEDWFRCWRNLQVGEQRQNQRMSEVALPGWNLAVSSPSVAMMMMFWVSLKWNSALFSLKMPTTWLTRFSAAYRLVPVFFPWTAEKYMKSWNLKIWWKVWFFYRCPVAEWGRNKHGPTLRVKIHHIRDDIIRTSADLRFCDVHNILGFTGEGQHVELQLDLIAVQLERTQAVTDWEKTNKQTSWSAWLNVQFSQTFLIREMVAFRDISKSCFLMLPDESSRM